MDYTNNPQFDGLYLQIASQTRGIDPLLDTLFSFLRRKSDFFSGDSNDIEKGVARAREKVNEVLEKHVRLFVEEKKREERKKEESAAKKKEEAKKKAVIEEDVIELDEDGGFDISNVPDKSVSKLDQSANEEKPAATATASAKPDEEVDNKKEDEEDEPAPIGNGGTTPKYVWTQTLSELSINIPLPPNTKAKDLTVSITKSHLKILHKSTNETIVDDSLSKPIIVDDSFWTIEDNNMLVLTLQKLNQMEWWPSPCVNDPQINLQKINPESSNLSDLDGETRKTVEKMMYDQRQKAMGRPTSEEEEKMEILERFKRSHPEMDFSNAKIG